LISVIRKEPEKGIGSYMQSIITDIRFQEIRTRLLEEIKPTQKRKHPDLHPLFNLTMQNKIDHANWILRLMDRYPNPELVK
jgi:hypothetical protein